MKLVQRRTNVRRLEGGCLPWLYHQLFADPRSNMAFRPEQQHKSGLIYGYSFDT